MAKQSTQKASTTLAENETLNGSNMLPALIEISANKSVQLGEIVMAAHQQSGMSVEAWNALPEVERDQLLNKTVENFKAANANAELVAAVEATSGNDIPPLPEPSRMVVAEQVLIVSAPGGPRRRAGFSFGPTAVELRFDELGPDPRATLEVLRSDPMLKIDGRFEELPADEEWSAARGQATLS